MESLLQDLRYGFRILFRHPGFTVIAVLSLSLGIGANSTIFSVIHTVMLRPLPYKDRERLVAIFETNLEQGQPKGWVATSNFFDWKRQNEVFDQMEWIAGASSMNLIGSGEPARVEVQYVTPNLLHWVCDQSSGAPSVRKTFS
jgi:putative ABC transport system permease protein